MFHWSTHATLLFDDTHSLGQTFMFRNLSLVSTPPTSCYFPEVPTVRLFGFPYDSVHEGLLDAGYT